MEEVFIKVGEGSAKKMEDRYDYNGRSHSWLGIHFLLVHGICRYCFKTDVLESADTDTVRLIGRLSFMSEIVFLKFDVLQTVIRQMTLSPEWP